MKTFRAVLINIPSNIVTLVLYTLVGLIMYATYINCDPKASGLITRADQVRVRAASAYDLNWWLNYSLLPVIAVLCCG